MSVAGALRRGASADNANHADQRTH
jgi:hypothetical protein